MLSYPTLPHMNEVRSVLVCFGFVWVPCGALPYGGESPARPSPLCVICGFPLRGPPPHRLYIYIYIDIHIFTQTDIIYTHTHTHTYIYIIR